MSEYIQVSNCSIGKSFLDDGGEQGIPMFLLPVQGSGICYEEDCRESSRGTDGYARLVVNIYRTLLRCRTTDCANYQPPEPRT